MAIDVSRLKVPAGSLVVDAALVVALIWGAATMTEQLEQINARVDAIESGNIRHNGEARLLVLERRADDSDEFKKEMRAQLGRIEDKLDRIYAAAK
jgi:hypothetical protein